MTGPEEALAARNRLLWRDFEEALDARSPVLIAQRILQLNPADRARAMLRISDIELLRDVKDEWQRLAQ